ncbi:MAG: DnaB-like helicase C-terminal domain-containing protein [Actinomycetes bacterium]
MTELDTRASGPGSTAADLLRVDGIGRTLSRPPWPTGFGSLDAHLGGGLHPGELTLLGGAQGLGKTTLSLQIARNIAVAGGSVVYVCYEHAEEELLARLLLMEAGLAAPYEPPVTRQALRALGDGEPVGGVLAAAADAVRSYGLRLRLVRGLPDGSGSGAIEELARRTRPDVLFVDYLQKVPSRNASTDEDERVTDVVERLKDLALALVVPVFAPVAADKSGLGATGRTRLNDLRGSTALAYEADVALMLNDKRRIVARHHLMFGSPEAAHFQDYVVCTIEKNRSGRAEVDLELRKRFSHGHFEPQDRLVAEQLLDERVHVE